MIKRICQTVNYLNEKEKEIKLNHGVKSIGRFARMVEV
jgi:hypothetical protein